MFNYLQFYITLARIPALSCRLGRIPYDCTFGALTYGVILVLWTWLMFFSFILGREKRVWCNSVALFVLPDLQILETLLLSFYAKILLLSFYAKNGLQFKTNLVYQESKRSWVFLYTEITKETVQYLKEHLLMWIIHWRKHSKHWLLYIPVDISIEM